MEKEEVLDLCEQALERIHNSRQRRKDRLIQEEILRRDWWRRWFWFLPKFDEESAEKSLQGESIFSEYYMTDLLYGSQECTIEDLMRLAENCIDGLLNVSAEDLKAIK
jgi:hypothetical protein